MKDLKPQKVCFDGDCYEVDSFTKLIPEICEFTTVEAFVRPMYKEEFMKSWIDLIPIMNERFVITVVEYYRRGHHRLSLIRRACSCRYCLSLVGSPERRKIFLLLLSRLLSITHTHTHTHSRRRGDKERQSSKCSFSLVVFSCFCAQREKKWSFAVTCSKLDFRFFFVQRYTKSCQTKNRRIFHGVCQCVQITAS